MRVSVFIDGAAGTTGLEIVQRLSGRSDLALIILDDAARKDRARRAEALNDADFSILCLPDEAAREAAALVTNPRARLIDASSAHRTDPAWTYGFAEFRTGQRARIVAAARVSNPGCYPTGFLALVAPLVARGLLPADWPYSVNAVSGYSGGGKALIDRFASDRGLAFRAYGLSLGHKHVAEMQQHAGLAHAPLFAPAVVPAYRGMLVDVPLPLAAMPRAASAADLRAALAEHYDGEAGIRLCDAAGVDELLLYDEVEPSDRLDLYVFASADGTQARLTARLDNLCKGASGAAVQNLNLMAGLPEYAGLML